MLTKYSSLDAYVCLDPVAATGVLEGLKEAGYDGQFVCFVDWENQVENTGGMEVEYVLFDHTEMAKASFDLALKLVTGETVSSPAVNISPSWY
jgi:ABC-type sugar transport system substrate-binding protein